MACAGASGAEIQTYPVCHGSLPSPLSLSTHTLHLDFRGITGIGITRWQGRRPGRTIVAGWRVIRGDPERAHVRHADKNEAAGAADAARAHPRVFLVDVVSR
jgi:hypothetical protein